MAELDKVIKGLEHCSTTDGNCQWAEHLDCPYIDDCKAEKYSALDRDALELLKEYQGAKPLIDAISDSVHETAKMFRQNDGLKHYDDGSSEP